LLFETQGPAPGAIIIEWNIKASGPAAAGMWDAHWRIGGTAGTQLQQDVCVKQPDQPTTAEKQARCSGAFLLLHVTPEADGYFENTWGWVSDHDLDFSDPIAGDRLQIDIYNGR